MSKPTPMPFMPSPRPRPINAPDAAQALTEASKDLGFGRPTMATTTAPPPREVAETPPPPVEAAPIKPAAPAPAKAAAEPVIPAAVSAPVSTKALARAKPAATKVAPSKAKVDAGFAPLADDGRAPSLRIEVTNALWDALRLEALKRRVTVKYLVYEALAAQGFDIDLAEVPEDGRRRKKMA